MISDVGRKKSTAANTHRLMDDEPLCAAAAIQRGPSTAAMLNSSTSQKPIARRNCDFGVAVSSAIGPFPLCVGVNAAKRHYSIVPCKHDSSRSSFIHKHAIPMPNPVR